MTATLAPRASPWAELPPDLLGDVSSRLHDAGDFVRLHAVCRPWRDALSSNARRTMFRPWIVAPYDDEILHSVINFTPSSSYRHRSRDNIVLAEPPAGASSTDEERNWVARADGTAAWFFTWSPEPGLIDLLTGATTSLPGFPDDDETKMSMDKPRGIVYDDGTIFLYAFTKNAIGPYVTVAISRPGDAEWTFMVQRVPLLGIYHLGYHDGKVLATHGSDCYYWCVLMPDFEANGDGMFVEAWNLIDETFTKYSMLDYNYILESRGELICVSVLVDPCADDNPMSHAFSVTVHAYEGVDAGGEMRRVARDNLSLGDRVLFLGSPASFAVDAAQLDMDGGCVFFTFRHSVFKYSLRDGEAQLLMQQCPEWSIDRTCVWLQPQPTIAPTRQIRERLARRTIQEQEN